MITLVLSVANCGLFVLMRIPDLYSSKRTTSNAYQLDLRIFDALKQIFVIEGAYETLMSDNAPQRTSQDSTAIAKK